MTTGDKVNWWYTPRGGYSWSHNVAAIVVASTGKRVRIAVFNLGSQQIEYRNVQPEKLSVRTVASVLDEQFAQMARSK